MVGCSWDIQGFDKYIMRRGEGGHIVKILWGTKIGDPDWEEELITECEERIPAATEWAKQNGFDRLRVAEMDDSPPDFTGTLNV